MGSTASALLLSDTHYLIGHVGDSRAYVLRRSGHLEKLTRDQTMAQSLADSGAIRQEDIARNPYRHVLTSALATRGAGASGSPRYFGFVTGGAASAGWRSTALEAVVKAMAR